MAPAGDVEILDVVLHGWSQFDNRRGQTEFKAVSVHVASEDLESEVSGFNRWMQHRLVGLIIDAH